MKKLSIILLILAFVSTVTFAQDKKMGVSVQGALVLPMGDFGDVAEMGFGGTGTFLYNLNKNLSITGTVGYISFSGKDDIGLDDYSFSMIPILAGVRYYFTPDKFKPYVSGQLGIYSTSVSYTMPSYTIGGVTFGGGEVDASDSEFGFAFGGGFLMPLGTSMNLDVNAAYNIVSDADFLGINVGVNFGL